MNYYDINQQKGRKGVRKRFALLCSLEEHAVSNLNRNLHGPAVDEVLADENTQNTLWALKDQFYSVRDLIYQTGGHHNHIDYDAFGKVISEWHPAPSWLPHAYGFQSRERDQESGLNFHRGRYLALK